MHLAGAKPLGRTDVLLIQRYSLDPPDDAIDLDLHNHAILQTIC